MKAFILAGGKGSRLRPITHTVNKQLIPVGGTPMIFRVISEMIDCNIKDILININAWDRTIPDAIDAAHFPEDVAISFVEQHEPNGMMYPLFLGREHLGNSPFIFHAGDNVLMDRLADHKAIFEKTDSTAHLLVSKVERPEAFGVAVVDAQGVLITTVEKPKTFVSNLAVTGIYFYRSGVFDALDHVQPIDPKGNGHFEYVPPTIHQWLVDHGHTVTTEEITGHWKDTGTPKDLLLASEILLQHQGKQHLGTNSVLEKTSLPDSIYIGKNTHLTNVTLGPGVTIGDGCTIKNTHISHAIIMNNVVIDSPNRLITNAIIGPRTVISPENMLLLGADARA